MRRLRSEELDIAEPQQFATLDFVLRNDPDEDDDEDEDEDDDREDDEDDEGVDDDGYSE